MQDPKTPLSIGCTTQKQDMSLQAHDDELVNVEATELNLEVLETQSKGTVHQPA